jgi:glutamyl-tRNA synthetase
MTAFEAVAARLPGKTEAFWLAVRGNIEKLADAEMWASVINGPMTPVIADEDRDFLAAASAALPAEPWDAGTWKAWTEAVKAATGRKGKPLFMPLRLALTGLDHGPELAALLPLIGRKRVLDRLA